MHLHSDAPGTGSKKPGLKLRSKMELDQEKGELTNNVYEGVIGYCLCFETELLCLCRRSCDKTLPQKVH